MALEAYARDSGREYVRFDYHGHGSSGGPFEECTLGGWIENALDILDKVSSGGPMVRLSDFLVIALGEGRFWSPY